MPNATHVRTNFNTVLAQTLKAGDSDTSILLSSAAGITYPAVLKVGSGTNIEWISFTGVSGNTITGCKRGLNTDAVNLSDVDVDNERNLPVGSTVTMVEHSQSINNKLEKDENATITASYDFNGGTHFFRTNLVSPVYASLAALNAAYPTPYGGQKGFFCTSEGKYYSAVGGAWVADESGGTFANASTTVAGKTQEATIAQAKAGTQAGSTGAELFVNPKYLGQSVQDGAWISGVSAVGTDSYAINPTPAVAAYAVNQKFRVKADVVNTGAASLNVSGLGAVTIKKAHDQDLETGDIEVGQIIEVIYDGTNFQLTSPTASQMSTANSNTLTAGATSNASALHKHSNMAPTFGNGTHVTTTIAHNLGVVPGRVEFNAFSATNLGVKMSSCFGIYNGTNTCCSYNGYSNGSDTTYVIYNYNDNSAYSRATVTVDATNINLSWTINGSVQEVYFTWKAFIV